MTADGPGTGAGAAERDDLMQRAKRGAVWVAAGHVLSLLLRLGSNLIMTRLLFKEAFGLMALASVVLTGLQLFSDVGIGPAIIQNQRGDDESFLNTAWTIQAGRGLLLCLATALLAWPASTFYGQPELLWILPVVGVSALASGFNATKLFTQNRALALGRLTLVDLGSQLGGVIIGVSWALLDRSVRALLAAGLSAAFLRLLLSHIALPGPRNRFHWDPDAFLAQMRFGRWIFLSTLLTFFAGESDKLIFGKILEENIGDLGVYSIAAMIAFVPPQGLGKLGDDILFALYAALHNRGEDFTPVFRRNQKTFLTAAGWATAGLIAGGPTAIRWLYDPRYVDAGWMIQLLSAGYWFLLLEMPYGAGLVARGKVPWIAAGSGIKVVGLMVGISAGYQFAGFPGAVFGFGIAESLRFALTLVGAYRNGLGQGAVDLAFSGWVGITGGVGFAAAEAMHGAEWPALLQAIGVFAVVSVMWLPFFVRYGRGLRRR